MNKEEAIQKLEKYKKVMNDLLTIITESTGLNCFEFDIEPFDMSIEALRAEDDEKMALQYAEGYKDGFLEGMKTAEGKE
jgi:hypothetical protein